MFPVTKVPPKKRTQKKFSNQPDFINKEKGVKNVTKSTAVIDYQSQHDPIIRLFVSSTFRDMTQERDYLAKQIFPQIQELCNSKGVIFSYVDLRWGITEDQAENGKTLSICLSEIDNCRPFFIGILGDRYGWVPDYDNPCWTEIIKQYPWLESHRGTKSITNLEILHGFLNHPEKSPETKMFFFRDSNSGSQTESPEALSQLKQLKDQIANKITYQSYNDITTFGELVLRGLTQKIESLFPKNKAQLSDLEREALFQKLFMKNYQKVYYGRVKQLAELNNILLNRSTTPVVVSGDSGCGKSAILAQWYLHCEKNLSSKYLIIPHFVGASPSSNNHVSIITRIIHLLSERFKLTEEIPSDPETLVSQFPKWLNLANEKGSVIIILDGLDMLIGSMGTSLCWIPNKLPSNVYIVLSGNKITLERNWSNVLIPPLEKDEINQIIDIHLKQFGKSLSTTQRDLILSSPQIRNILYLNTFLKEISIFGIFEELTYYISHLLTNTDPSLAIYNLILKILHRFVQDYSTVNPNLVSELFTYLVISKNGLSITELSQLCSTSALQITAILSAATQSLVFKTGDLFQISHKQIQKAVETMFVSEKLDVHQKMANFFKYSGNISQIRKLENIPWHLYKAKNWDQLASYLGSVENFEKLAKNRFDFLKFWRKLIANQIEHLTMDKLVQNLADFQNSPEIYLPKMETLVKFLIDAADYKSVGVLLSKSESISSQNPEFYLKFLKFNGLNYYKMGKYKMAESYYLKAMDLVNISAVDERIELEDLLGYIYGKIGDFDKAIGFFEGAYIKLRSKTTPQAARIIHNLGWVYFKMANYPKAMDNYTKALQIYEDNYGVLDPGYISLCTDISEVNYKLGNYIEAETNYIKCKSQLEELLGPEHPQVAHVITRLGYLYGKLNKFSEASGLYQRAVKIWIRVVGKKHINYAAALHYLGWIYFKLGKFNLAQPLYTESLSIRISILGLNHQDTAEVLHDTGELLYKLGKYDEAKETYLQCIEIRKDILGNNHTSLAWTYNNMGYLFGKKSDYKQAEEYFKKAMDIWKKVLGTKHANYGLVMHNLGWINMKLERYKESKKLYETALIVRRNALGQEHADTIDTLNDLGELSYRMKDYTNAERLYFSCLKIREKIFGPLHSSVGWSHNNIGLLMLTTGRLQQALVHFKICLQVWDKCYGEGKHPNCGLSRHNLARVMATMKNPNAENLFNEALDIRKKTLGDESADVADTLLELGKIYVEKEKFTQAESFLEKALTIRKRKFGENHPLVWEVHQVQIYDISKKKIGEVDLNKIFAPTTVVEVD